MADAEQRQEVLQAIDGLGLRTASADDGAAAKAWLAANPRPALLVLDLDAARADGFALLDSLKREESLRDVRKIILSGETLSAAELEYLHGIAGAVITRGEDAAASLLAALKEPAAVAGG